MYHHPHSLVKETLKKTLILKLWHIQIDRQDGRLKQTMMRVLLIMKEDSGSAEGSKTDDKGGKVMENKVIRTIKEVDDSGKGTMPLLATVVDEKKKENILDTKKVKTTE